MTTLAYDDEGLVDKKHYFLPGEEFVEQTIPVFKYERILNQNRSLDEGRPVVDIREVVELRFAQNPGYRPVFPVEATWRTINGRVVTFAERWKEQREAFLNGEQQHAIGTPLEELKAYGATPAMISLCRASNIQTIEALNDLQGSARKRLGVVGNEMIPMAQKWVEARNAAVGSENAERIKELEEQVKALLASKAGEAIENEESFADYRAVLATVAGGTTDPYPDKSDADLKDMIAARSGAKPRGNPSRATLIQSLAE